MFIQNMDTGIILFACPFNQMKSFPRYLHLQFIPSLKKNESGVFFDSFLTYNLYCLSKCELWYSVGLCNFSPPLSNFFVKQESLLSHPCSSSLRIAPDLPFPLLFWSSHSLALRKPELRFLKVKNNNLILIGIEGLKFIM